MAENDPFLVVFGRRLRELREGAGLTQLALAGLVGVHRVHIARIESGSEDVKLTTLRRLASALGVPPGDLLTQPAARPMGKRK